MVARRRGDREEDSSQLHDGTMLIRDVAVNLVWEKGLVFERSGILPGRLASAPVSRNPTNFQGARRVCSYFLVVPRSPPP